MTSWITNGMTAIVAGGAIFLALLLPALIWQHRRFGAFNPARTLGLIALCLYGAALVTYTFLPLPERSQAWCDAHAVGANLTPFAFLGDIARETAGLPLLQRLTSFPVLQVVFNVALFVPFGAIARRYFHRSAAVSIALGAATSLLIEASQYTGLWGIYPCAFRVADIDDVLLNTFGAALGVALAPLALFWMPAAHELARRRMVPRPVTLGRRWLGMLIDLFLVGALTAGLHANIVMFASALGGPPRTSMVIEFVIASLLVFWWPAARGSGASIGQMAVWLAPIWRRDGEITLGTAAQRLARVSIVPGACLLLLLDRGSGFAFFVPGIVLFAALAVPFTRGYRGLSAWATGAEIIDSRSQFFRNIGHIEPGGDQLLPKRNNLAP